MIYFFPVFSFIFGLIVGSFLNCVIYRLETEQSFLKGRSFCPECKHILKWYDLVPLLSFLMLGGKCRYCAKKISPQYPIVEILTGLLFLLIFNSQSSISNEFLILNFQTIINIVYLFLIAAFLVVIFTYDLKHYLIPDSVVFFAIGVVLLYRLFEVIWRWKLSAFGWIAVGKEIGNSQGFLNPLIAALGAGAFFLLIFLISRGKWMGFGDVKLALFMGLFLGYPNILVALFLAFFIGAIIGIGLILAKKKGMKSELPFGPFLILGTLISLFWGQILIHWYLNLFNIAIY